MGSFVGFGWFSLIRAENRLPFVVLDSGLCKDGSEIFEIFSQPFGLVGKPNQPVHLVRFAGMAVCVVCVICVHSWSFGVGIALCLSF